MTISGSSTFHVIPLSIQREGEEYLVGNQKIEEFYQFPEEGVRVIKHLQDGETIDSIKALCAAEFKEPIDVDDFVSLLLEIGFIHDPKDQASFHHKANADTGDKRWVFRANAGLAGLFFSIPAFIIYILVIASACVLALDDPRLRVNLDALYIKNNLTLALVSLLLLHSFVTVLHELGHMLAVAKYGIESKLGIGNRLWSIVAEADLSGILALPKRQRYLPLWAGIIVDLFSIAVITLLIKMLLLSSADPFIVQIMQALVLQILFTISWQFNLFLKTDIYYILCNYYSYPNLDAEARTYLKQKLHQVSLGALGVAHAGSYHKISMLRAFAAVWVFGRIAALGLLFLVVIPTLLRYGQDAYSAATGQSSGNQWDIGSFVLISVLLFSAGMYMWIKGKIRANKGIAHVANN